MHCFGDTAPLIIEWPTSRFYVGTGRYGTYITNPPSQFVVIYIVNRVVKGILYLLYYPGSIYTTEQNNNELGQEANPKTIGWSPSSYSYQGDYRIAS